VEICVIRGRKMVVRDTNRIIQSATNLVFLQAITQVKPRKNAYSLNCTL